MRHLYTNVMSHKLRIALHTTEKSHMHYEEQDSERSFYMIEAFQ